MDIYKEITNQIIEAIETGALNNEKLWQDTAALGMPANFQTRKQYSGVNVLVLWATAKRKGHSSNYWLTFNQAQAIGGKVRKGEKAVMGVYFQPLERAEINEETGETERAVIPMLKPFWVFNLDQIDGIERPLPYTPATFEAIEQAEHILAMSGARLHIGGTRAFYSPVQDAIHMPDRERFSKAENFYTVALHELTHWTGHSRRLNRDFSGRFGSEAYAFEELVAELGSAFINADMGFVDTSLEHHAGYLDSWLTVLKKDKRAIFTAAKLATSAHQYIMSLAAISERAAA